MATMKETTLDFSKYRLQVPPLSPLYIPWNKREGSFIVAPPPSRQPSSRRSGYWSEKANRTLAPPPYRETSSPSSEQWLKKGLELPPVDRGAGAWKYLFAAFMIEGFMFGFPINYGVFQDYYSRHGPFVGNTNMSTIGTLGTCFYFLGAPIATYLVQKYSRWQRETIWAGFTISIVGVGAAGWAKDFPSLVGTQGLTFGMGMLIMYYPIFNMLNEWFVERRGLALGVICASTGITGLFYPFVLEILLSKYGPEMTLRISALGMLVLCGPCIPLFKNRIPVPRTTAKSSAAAKKTRTTTDYCFLKMPLFYFFTLTGLLQGLGFYFPTIYMPSYATSLGLSSTMGALLLVVYSLAQVLGQMAFGYVSDMRVKRFWPDGRVPVEILVFLSPLVSGVAILGLWGPAKGLGMLIAFAIAYGASAGGFAVLWARMSSTLSPSPALALTTFSYFACAKGVGNVVTGPISSALISLTPQVDKSAYAGGRFGGIVLYSGACMLASALVMVVWWAWRELRGFTRGREGRRGFGSLA